MENELERAINLTTSELMAIIIQRLELTNGLDFCSQEQCLALYNFIEEKAFQ